MDTSDSTPKKVCCTCGKEYPATTQYFYRQIHGKHGLMGTCKACKKADRNNPEKKSKQSQYLKEWGKKNRLKRNEQARERRKRNPKISEYQREWRQKNRSKTREYSRKSRIKHLDIRRQKDREFAKRHSAERVIYNKQWRKKNPEKQSVIEKRYYWNNREERLAKNKEWRDTPRGKAVKHALEFKRRALKKHNGGMYTAVDIETHFRTQKGRCWWCGCELDPSSHHVDHRIALSRGGANSANNICISCPKCNLTKNNKYPWDFNGRLL